ncbi:hypothetical protein ACHAXM_003220 [Skeletonema potamos]
MIELSELTELHLSAHSSCLKGDKERYLWCSLIQFYLRPNPMSLDVDWDEVDCDPQVISEILGRRRDLREVKVNVSTSCIIQIFISSRSRDLRITIVTYCLQSFRV